MKKERGFWLAIVFAMASTTLACSTLTAAFDGFDAVGSPEAETATTVASPVPLEQATEPDPGSGDLNPEEADLALAGPEVFLVDLETTAAQSIVPPSEGVLYYSYPQWSPDGEWIAFLGQAQTDDGGFHGLLFVVRLDGSDLRQLTGLEDPSVQSFDWAPFENRLAVSAAQPGEGFEAFSIGLEEGQLRPLTEQGGEDPAWSPTGDRLAISAFREEDYQLYLLDPEDPAGQQQITSSPGRAFQPAWSPSAGRLAFASDRDGSYDNFDIYVVGAGGEDRKRLTESEWHEIRPRWSPNGDRVAFLRQRIEGRAAYDVVLMDPDGSDELNLTAEALEEGEVPTESPMSWSPDGSRLAILGFNDVIYVLDAAGEGLDAYDLGSGVTGHPAWRLPR